MTTKPTMTIRLARPDDAQAIQRIRADPEVRRYQPLEQRDVTEIASMLKSRAPQRLGSDTVGKVQWIIEVDTIVAGWVTISVTSRTHRTGSIGYSLDPRFHGCGIATQAVRKVIHIALDPAQLALERLEAVAAVDNIASRRVLEKCGFAFEGVAEGYLIIDGRRVDHARYARVQRNPHS